MSRRGIVLFSLMAVIWGIPYLLIRIAVAEVAPTVLVFGRTAIAALILVPIVAARGEIGGVLDRWRWVVVFAVIEIAAPWVLVADAERSISSSMAALLIAGVPLVGAVIAIGSAGGERIGPLTIVGLLVGLAGVLAIVGLDASATGLLPVLEMAVVVVCYAVGPVILVRRLGGVSGMAVSAVALGLCAIGYAPLAIAQWPAATPSPEAVASIVALGVVCTAVAFVLFAALIAEVGPMRATVITYVNPAVATVLGVVLLHEALTPGLVVGFVLVLVGSALATRPAGAPGPAPVPAVTRPGDARTGPLADGPVSTPPPP